MWAPKVTSAQVWGQALHMVAVTSQVLFSSVAALLGSAGQANYSAANGALDALAAQWAAQVTNPPQQSTLFVLLLFALLPLALAACCLSPSIIGISTLLCCVRVMGSALPCTFLA